MAPFIPRSFSHLEDLLPPVFRCGPVFDDLPWDDGDHISNHSMCPWFRFAPVTMVTSTIKHSEIGVMCTNLAIERGPHIAGGDRILINPW